MQIWTIAILIVVVGTLFIFDAFKIIREKKPTIHLPLILPSKNQGNSEQRVFNNELMYGVVTIILGLIILEIGYINFGAKALYLIFGYLLIDLKGYVTARVYWLYKNMYDLILLSLTTPTKESTRFSYLIDSFVIVMDKAENHLGTDPSDSSLE